MITHEAQVAIIGTVTTKPKYVQTKTTFNLEVLRDKKKDTFVIETSGVQAKQDKAYIKIGMVIFVSGELVTEERKKKVLAKETNILTWSKKYTK